MELLQNSDPAFSKILEGWGKKNPQEVFDYFAELDIKSPQVQSYLEKTNFREYPFMDQLSNSLIEGLMHSDPGNSIGDFEVDQINTILLNNRKQDLFDKLRDSIFINSTKGLDYEVY